MDKTIAFKIAYLLGVEEAVLSRDYIDDYEASDNLKLFKNYEDANKLRYLSRMRQSAIRYKHAYESAKSIKEATTSYLAKETNYLSQKGIDLEKIYKEKGLITYINILTEMINVIKYKVLVDLEIPRPEKLQEYFYFPHFTKESLDQFMKQYKTVATAHGTVIYRGLNIRQSLCYSLTNDKNVMLSIYSMIGERYDNGVGLNIPYIWRKERGISLDEEAIINQADIIEKVELLNKDSKLGAEISNPMILDNNIVVIPENTTHLDMNILEFTSTKGVEIFVDCDNTDFFKFINFLKGLEVSNIVQTIKLIVDSKSSFLWKVIKEVYDGTTPIELIQVQRIKEQKSVVDIVLTKEVCESYYLRGLKKAVLVSSDSDFFGLITSLPELEFCIGYTDRCMSEEYLDYLVGKGIETYNLTTLDTVELVEKYKDISIDYLIGYTFALTPISRWNTETLTRLVEFNFNKETDIELENNYISNRIDKALESVKVEIKDGITYITVNDVVVNTNLI